MSNIADDGRRRIFSAWLRTGRFPPVQNADIVEFKFNPWHDPKDGRFTFANSGQFHGRGSGQAPSHGGGFGGAGASGTWNPPGQGTASEHSNRSSKKKASERRAHPVDAAKRASVRAAVMAGSEEAENFREVDRNGYTYAIDRQGRTRRVTGQLDLAETPVRSRSAQARAGGDDRRSGDDGGHYIAARFKGPTEAFNHFAQDANFNRGSYRALEDQWARAKRTGKTVSMRIVPTFRGSSSRPAFINVWFRIDGHLERQKFPNERTDKTSGK